MTRDFRQGVVDALPLAAAYASYAIPFGMLAAQAGLPLWAVIAMSFFVYAGVAQLMAIQLILLGLGAFEIAVATLFINLRYLFFCTSLALKLPKMRGWKPFYIAFVTSDETYGVNMSRSEPGKKLSPDTVLGTVLFAHLTWVTASTLGVIVGERLGPLDMLSGILPMIFAVLMSLFIKTWKDVVLAAVAGLCTYALLCIVPGHHAFLVTTIVVPTLGVLMTKDRHADA
jgi:4-azaleucine resistance transporter AzlC